MKSLHEHSAVVVIRILRARIVAVSAIIVLLATLSLPLTTVAANPATVTLSPASQVAVVGATVHLTATVKLANVPVPNVTVQFNVSGTNTVARSAVTNSQGQASFSYSSAESGSDSVTAKVGSVTSTAAAVDWIDTTAAKIAVSPSSINALVGSSQTFTATVTDSNGKGVAGVDVWYMVTGENPASATSAGMTDANGKVTFNLKGTKAGTDTITAFTDLNGSKTLDTGEFSATATVTWTSATSVTLSPSSGTMYTGTALTLTATVTDANGNPIQGVTVNYSISGANPASGTAMTDANGQATFSDSGKNAGVDTVHASVSGISSPASATIQWITGPATLTLAASSTTPTVNSAVTVTATLKDKNSGPVANVKILFTVSGANTSNGSASTGSNGQARFNDTGTKSGADTVTAFADLNGNGKQDTGEPSKTLTITWAGGGAASLTLSPSAQSQNIGTTASLTAQLTNPGGSVSGIKIYFNVSGANSKSTTMTTDASGKAVFSYNGANSGTDAVKAWADLNGNGTKDADEPSATASVTWVTTGAFQPAQPASPRAGCTYFPQTKHNLCAGFQAYWNQFGGLETYGFPLTEEFQENGVTVQYFERARFEWHPGAWPSRFDVLLGLVGNEVTAGRSNEMPFKMTSANNSSACSYYAATGHNLCAGFRAFWNAFGGLAVYGYPISEEFKEKNPDTGQVYTVQYFQRARFEWHPGAAPSRYDVELGRLGAQVLQMKYGVSYY